MFEKKDNSLEDDFLAGDILLDDLDDLDQIGDDGEDDSTDGDNADGDTSGQDVAAPKSTDTKTKSASKAADGNGTDDVDSDNEHYLRGLYWQEQNIIPKDAVLSPTMTQLDLEDLYASSIHDNAMSTYKAEIKDRLTARGINPDDIFNTSQNEEVMFRDAYQAIAKTTFEDLEEKYTSTADLAKTIKDLGTEYFISKGAGSLEKDAIELLVQKDFDKSTEEELYEKYQKHFASEATRLSAKIASDIDAKKKKDLSNAESDAIKIKQRLESGEIGGKKYNAEEIKKIQEALYVKNQIYVAPDGSRQRVTLYKKRKLEAENSLERQVELAAHLVLGVREDEIKEKSERRGKSDLLNKLANAAGNTTNSQTKKNSKPEMVPADQDIYLDD